MSSANAAPAITETFTMDQLREQAAAERDPKTVDWVEGKPDIENPVHKNQIPWLVSVPVSDVNFKTALASANLETLQAALEQPLVPNSNRERIEARIRRLQRESAGGYESHLAIAPGALTDEEEPTSGPLVSVSGEGSVSAEFRKRRLIVELQALDELEARTQYEAGKRFAELQTLCERGEFLRILQENLNGKSQRSAYEYIRFYKMCEQVPALSGALEKNFTKALTLRNALREEGLEVDALNSQEFAKDITPEAIDTMSAAQLKAQVKKLTREVSAVVKEETKALTQERDALIKERDEALARLEGRTWKAAREASLKLAELAETFARRTADLIALMPADEEVPHDLAISLETTLFRVSTAAEKANREFHVRLDGN
jgi:hypothetical protein